MSNDSEKAITLQQPYASLVVDGVKTVIDQDKSTDYRGTLYIHAGASAAEWEPTTPRFEEPSLLALGAIVGSCQLVDCVPVEDADVDDEQAEMGDFSEGRYVWIIEDAQAMEPVSMSGHGGLWTPKWD